jgi:hypothetical protein
VPGTPEIEVPPAPEDEADSAYPRKKPALDVG